jgi:hypothetical protein
MFDVLIIIHLNNLVPGLTFCGTIIFRESAVRAVLVCGSTVTANRRVVGVLFGGFCELHVFD